MNEVEHTDSWKLGVAIETLKAHRRMIEDMRNLNTHSVIIDAYEASFKVLDSLIDPKETT